MSDLIVSKPFLRGNKRFRRNDPAPTDLDKPTLVEYLRLGMLTPSENKPAAPARQPARAEPKRRETPGPRTTKPAGAADGGAVAIADASSPGAQLSSSSTTDGVQTAVAADGSGNGATAQESAATAAADAGVAEHGKGG